MVWSSVGRFRHPEGPGTWGPCWFSFGMGGGGMIYVILLGGCEAAKPCGVGWSRLGTAAGKPPNPDVLLFPSRAEQSSGARDALNAECGGSRGDCVPLAPLPSLTPFVWVCFYLFCGRALGAWPRPAVVPPPCGSFGSSPARPSTFGPCCFWGAPGYRWRKAAPSLPLGLSRFQTGA